MKFKRSLFKDIIIIQPKKIFDKRGYFYESFRLDKLNTYLKKRFVVKQENESSSIKGVFRGLHFQRKPYAQAKLVRVMEGKIIDFVTDIRIGSKNYGKTIFFNLSDENNLQVFVPEGFAHGFYVLSKKAIVNYKVNNFFSKDYDDGISVQNNLFIKKILKNKKIILSKKDANLPLFQESYKGFKF